MIEKSSLLILGVDGGGTGCRAAVSAPGQRILGYAEGGPGNVESDFDGAITTIKTCINNALTQAGLETASPDRIVAHIGVAGTNDGPLVEKTAAAFTFCKTTVTGDRTTTVRGVLGDKDGHVVALGTGTIIARQKAGQMRAVGGWGFHLSDRASGAWLGRRLLEETVLAEDGLITHTACTKTVLDEIGHAPDIFMWSSSAKPKDYAMFAPQVMRSADAHDPVAKAIVAEGAEYIQKALDSLGYATGGPLSFTGGIGPLYIPHLNPSLTTNIVMPEGNALDGAVALARETAQRLLRGSSR